MILFYTPCTDRGVDLQNSALMWNNNVIGSKTLTRQCSLHFEYFLTFTIYWIQSSTYCRPVLVSIFKLIYTESLFMIKV